MALFGQYIIEQKEKKKNLSTNYKSNTTILGTFMAMKTSREKEKKKKSSKWDANEY